MADSSQTRNAVPICTACAPASSARLISAPSMMPPAAITGISTAATTCGSNSNVVSVASVCGTRKVPRWPPDSTPEAITASAPMAAQACASATVVMVPMTKISASRKRATCEALKISKVKLATLGRSSSNISNWTLKSSHHLAGIGNSAQPSDDQIGRNNSAAYASSAWSTLGGFCTKKFRQNGLSVSALICSTCSRIFSGDNREQASEPSAPAFDTAAICAGVLLPPAVGPWMMGCGNSVLSGIATTSKTALPARKTSYSHVYQALKTAFQPVYKSMDIHRHQM